MECHLDSCLGSGECRHCFLGKALGRSAPVSSCELLADFTHLKNTRKEDIMPTDHQQQVKIEVDMMKYTWKTGI